MQALDLVVVVCSTADFRALVHSFCANLDLHWKALWKNRCMQGLVSVFLRVADVVPSCSFHGLPAFRHLSHHSLASFLFRNPGLRVQDDSKRYEVHNLFELEFLTQHLSVNREAVLDTAVHAEGRNLLELREIRQRKLHLPDGVSQQSTVLLQPLPDKHAHMVVLLRIKVHKREFFELCMHRLEAQCVRQRHVHFQYLLQMFLGLPGQGAHRKMS
mmetsp:Transcript_31831/g.123581  ORF Transcript_31831/g.123581 Transcript_31831/m.123581 type:complete len:215 (-) Transcript_31831:842-1486(-)